MEAQEKKYEVLLSSSELRYLVSCSFALLLNIPKGSLSTYTPFTKDEIIEFSLRMRKFMDDNNLDM